MVRWDDRIAAHRAVPSDWPGIQEVLARAGVDCCLEGPALETLAQPPELRAYQRAALDTWIACGRRGVVVLPTGAGKTRVALAAMTEARLPALVLVPTRALLTQWADAIAGLGAGSIGRIGDGHDDVQPLTVATYESAWRRAPLLGNRFGLLVVDEAHHAGGTLRMEPLAMSLAPYRLGLTALVPGARAMSDLAGTVGPVVFHLRVRDLAGGSLAPLQLVGLGLDLTPDEHARFLGDMALYRAERARLALHLMGLPWSGVVRTLARTVAGRRALAARSRALVLASFTRAKAIVLAAILDRHRDDRILVFTRDNSSAYAISRAHLVPALTCDIKARERQEVLAAFACGRIRALVSARVLDEGVDVPEACVAVIVGASGSDRQHVQRVGRILRPAPGKRAVVYDLFNVEAGDASRAALRRAAVAG